MTTCRSSRPTRTPGATIRSASTFAPPACRSSSTPSTARGLTPEALAGAPCARLALHARRIDLPAPRGEGRLVIEAPLAPDLAALAEWLDARGQGQPSGA